MKIAYSLSSILIVSAILTLTGCKARDAASNSPMTPSPASSNTISNSNQPTGTANANQAGSPEKESAANPGANAPAQLLGTYESREVQDKEGVITVISQLRTLWLFSSDGTYSRVSQVKGKPYHADSGTFRTEAPNKLVLTIQTTGLKGKRTIQNPPLSKTHIFTLSPDGEELRLTSEKGSVGIFRRVAKPKTS